MSENADKTWTEQKQHVLDPPVDKRHKTKLQVRKMIMYCASACWLLRFRKEAFSQSGCISLLKEKSEYCIQTNARGGPELSKVIHCVQQHGKNQHEFLPNIPGCRDAPQEKRVKTYWTYGRRGVTKWGCERVSKSKVKVLIFLALK